MEEPAACNVPEVEIDVPVTTLPKSYAAGASASCPGLTPEPETATLSWLFDASERIARLPDVAPAETGVKVRLNVRLCPGVRVIGGLSPLAVNAAFDMAAWEMFTAAEPVLITEATELFESPTITVPNATLAGDAAISPPATPEPDKFSAEVKGLSLRSFHQFWVTRETVPLAGAATVGVNVTLKDMLWPAGTATGQEIPLIVYPAPLTLAWKMPILRLVMFLTTTD